MSTNSSGTAKLPKPPISEDRIKSALDSKMDAIYKHEEIIWKVRAGYLAILYSGLTFLVGKLSLESGGPQELTKSGGLKELATVMPGWQFSC